MELLGFWKKINKMPPKTQCVKIWDKYIEVSGLLHPQKFWNKLKIFKALSVKYMLTWIIYGLEHKKNELKKKT